MKDTNNEGMVLVWERARLIANYWKHDNKKPLDYKALYEMFLKP